MGIHNENTIVIMSTSDCNAKCKHCYVGYQGSFEGEKLFDLTRSLINEHNVFINGTELILHPEYFQSAKIAAQTRLLTNGIEIANNPSVLDELKQNGINTIQMSYHFGIHDGISSVSKNIVQKAISYIKDKGLHLRLMTTLNKDNYQGVENFCKQAVGMGADSIRFTNYINTGNALKCSNKVALNDNEIGEVLESINRAREQHDKSKFYVQRCGSFGKVQGVKNNFECMAGNKLFTVTPNLDVFPCLFLTDPNHKIGEIRNNKLYLTKSLKNDGETCLAKEILNKGNEAENYF